MSAIPQDRALQAARALACKPAGAGGVAYCECGDYFQTARDWQAGACANCRADHAEGREDADASYDTEGGR